MRSDKRSGFAGNALSRNGTLRPEVFSDVSATIDFFAADCGLGVLILVATIPALRVGSIEGRG
jgi:hypothetical protein